MKSNSIYYYIPPYYSIFEKMPLFSQMPSVGVELATSGLALPAHTLTTTPLGLASIPITIKYVLPLEA